MFGAYTSNKELMTLYFAILVLLLLVNLIVGLIMVFKTGRVESKIELNSTSISGKENYANRG